MPKTFLSLVETISLPAEKWNTLLGNSAFLNADFEVQNSVYQEIFKSWDHLNSPPPPAWTPSKADIQKTNIFKFMQKKRLNTYSDLHVWSVKNRSEFWQDIVEELGIQFETPFSHVLDPQSPETQPRWFAGARYNIAQSCFLAEANQTAVVYQPENGDLRRITYGELKIKSEQVAACLQKMGFRKGDAIAIDMLMTVESVFVYLGIVLAGCAVVSIADSFAPHEIATRIRISNAKLIFTQDVIKRGGKVLPLFSKVTEATEIPAIVIPSDLDSNLKISLRSQDKSWTQFLSLSTGENFKVEICDSESPLNILFSSGTTGDPKAIPWNHSTPLKCASDAYFHHDIQRGDVVAWPTNLGWMMGPWLLFATFLNRGTVALYYGAPLTREFGLFVQTAKVNMLGLVPSLVKVWRNTGCMKSLDWTAIKLFSSTGECSNAEDYLFLMSLAKFKPVVEYCGGTEIGGGFLTGTLAQSASPATFSTPALGLDIVILDENLKKSDRDGELYIVPPSVGLSTSLLNKNHDEVYFKNSPRDSNGTLLRKHGDQMEYLPGGYVRALGRADDTMNLGGIKVSSAEIERALTDVEGVLETAAVAVNPPGGGPSLLKIFYVAKLNSQDSVEKIQKDFQKAISTRLNPLFKVSAVQKLDLLPRTASNKVMRRLLR